MEKLEVAYRALRTLAEILEEPPTKIVRDATIQRFENSFEACWKALKAYLDETEVIVCNSPKSSSGLLSGSVCLTRKRPSLLYT